MKRLLLTSALVISTVAGAANAQATMQMRNAVDAYIGSAHYRLDISSLTDTQVVELYGAITSTDDQEERDARVRAVLSEDNVVTYERPTTLLIADVDMPRDQIFTTVQSRLVGTEFEGQAWTLTDDELVEVFTLLNSSDDQSDAMTRLNAYFQ